MNKVQDIIRSKEKKSNLKNIGSKPLSIEEYKKRTQKPPNITKTITTSFQKIKTRGGQESKFRSELKDLYRILNMCTDQEKTKLLNQVEKLKT